MIHILLPFSIVVALEACTQLHAHHVGAGPRLAHRQRAHMFAGNQLWQVLLLLRVAAAELELIGRKDSNVRRRRAPTAPLARLISIATT